MKPTKKQGFEAPGTFPDAWFVVEQKPSGNLQTWVQPALITNSIHVWNITTQCIIFTSTSSEYRRDSQDILTKPFSTSSQEHQQDYGNGIQGNTRKTRSLREGSQRCLAIREGRSFARDERLWFLHHAARLSFRV
ncbi:hypothetical protein OS493_009262 [Desmophyllum pertusum]|uniref:Uncharacterized protein n=1 Tax=Desmophyllum pertusum TaxID=174260 RepID=A0A9X0CSD7_9CNID|nr:hypothetical protein OS493_009262 [Desmophyllum pertusum]